MLLVTHVLPSGNWVNCIVFDRESNLFSSVFYFYYYPLILGFSLLFKGNNIFRDELDIVAIVIDSAKKTRFKKIKRFSFSLKTGQQTFSPFLILSSIRNFEYSQQLSLWEKQVHIVLFLPPFTYFAVAPTVVSEIHTAVSLFIF